MPARAATIATYNVHHGTGSDGRCDPKRTVAAIQSLEADIVALQEVESRPSRVSEDLFAAIGESCGGHVHAAPTLRDADGDFGNMLISRWPIQRAQTVDLSVPWREPRNAIDAVVETEVAGPLRVIATHFGLARRERRHQAQGLAEHLDRTPEVPTVVIGDFNEWRRSGPVSRLLAQHLSPLAAAPTYPARLPVWPLDRVWCRPLGLVARARVVRSPLTRLASDHLPLVAHLS